MPKTCWWDNQGSEPEQSPAGARAPSGLGNAATPPAQGHTQAGELPVTRMRICSTPGCPNPHPNPGRCPQCRSKAEHIRRPHGNPYSTPGHRTFRTHVLTRDPHCVCPGDCDSHEGQCGQPSTVADHFPHERRDLITQGLDPNNPQYGRGLCKPCHDRKTARTNPAGWHQNPPK